MEVIFNLDEVGQVAADFTGALQNRKVVALHGEMGAGKTTLVQAFCRALGVRDIMASPTFSIINEYTAGNGSPLYHIDLYRLNSEAEAVQAGVEDCLYSGNTCFVEWPERAPGIFPDDTVHIHIEPVDDTRRKLKYNL